MENADSKADPNTGNTCPNAEAIPNSNPSDAGTNRRRTPFTNLSQVDADLALARTLQEQERAYMMLREGRGGSSYGSWEVGGYEVEEDDYEDISEEDYDGSDVEEEDDDGENGDEIDGEEDEEEDAFDANAHGEEVDGDENVELDPSAYSSDEAYARALQDAEDREMATRMLALAGMNEILVVDDDDEEDDDDEDEEEHGGNSQDAWEEVDPDELSYEELIALGEVVGTQSRGLSADTISSLPSINYKCQGTSEGINDSCVICRLDYEDDDTLIVLSCKHSYHSECINNWLQINKVCPVCSAEVTSVKS